MTKRADGKFQRNLADFYATPLEAVLPLLPHLDPGSAFAEPCAGDGALVAHLEGHGFRCSYSNDINSGFTERGGRNALDLNVFDLNGAEVIITNPPYTREVMHALILHLSALAPTWLLLELDWFATLQSAPYVGRCSTIVPIGRVRWIPNSRFMGFDNYVWARFTTNNSLTRFHPREPVTLPVEPRGPTEADKCLREWAKELNRDMIRECMEGLKK